MSIEYDAETGLIGWIIGWVLGLGSWISIITIFIHRVANN